MTLQAVDSIGSLTLIAEFGASTPIVEIRSNGLSGDRSVTLYEVRTSDGNFYAIATNGDPVIWHSRDEMRSDLRDWAIARLSEIGADDKPLENEDGNDDATEETCWMVCFADADDVRQWASGR